MLAVVQVSFPYSPDGFTSRYLRAGERHDIRDDLFKGLEDGGWIKRMGPLRAPEAQAAPGPPETAARGRRRFAAE
jgi:hypothetical protein